MPVTYTISVGDVSAVSTLTAGVVFDWTNETITFPTLVNQVTAQSLVNHIRFAEDRFVGMGRPPILFNTGGKTNIGTDPDTSSPITTPVVAILEDSWEIVTAKTSGVFVVRDIYRADGSIPYQDVAGVFIQYLTTVSGAVANTTTGSGLDSTQSTQLSNAAANSARLAGLLENTGVYDRFLTTALEQGPSGGGGGVSQETLDAIAAILANTSYTAGVVGDILDDTGVIIPALIAGLPAPGDATLANQTSIINALTAIQGTGFDTATDSLVQLQSDVAAIPTNPLLVTNYVAPDNTSITTLLGRLTNERAEALDNLAGPIDANIIQVAGSSVAGVSAFHANVEGELTAYGAAKATDLDTINTQVTELYRRQGLEIGYTSEVSDAQVGQDGYLTVTRDSDSVVIIEQTLNKPNENTTKISRD
jgi:hypothetical protein